MEEFLAEKETLYYSEKKVHIDPSFILRLLVKHQMEKETVYCLALMGNYEETILKAVSLDCMSLPKRMIAREKSAEKKKTYLTILIQEMIKQKVPTQTLLEMINKFKEEGHSDITIDSFLPDFDDNTEISLFKDQLARSLLESKKEIDEFKKSMQEYSRCVDQIYHDYFVFRAQKQIVRADAECEECFGSILTSEFVSFPCDHAFHKVTLSQFVSLSSGSLLAFPCLKLKFFLVLFVFFFGYFS